MSSTAFAERKANLENPTISLSVAPAELLPTLRCPTLAEARAAFGQVRGFTARLCETLEPEDCVVQSMTDASPIRWHLAHTTWFFETFVLKAFCDAPPQVDPTFQLLFNSYYNTVGEQFPRDQRGRLSRPTVGQVWQYRQQIDRAMFDWLQQLDAATWQQAGPILQLGLQHEQQHQELILTDIKHAFSINPLRPVFLQGCDAPADVPAGNAAESGSADNRSAAPRWVAYDEQIAWIGYDGDGFAYDNESPRHRVLVPAFELADRLVTNGEYLEFVRSGGYRQPQHWLSAGWDTVQRDSWQSPLYWVQQDGQWYEFTLAGLRPLRDAEPVCHVSYFEADAFARWAGCCLPTEYQWELAAQGLPLEGPFADAGCYHPRPAPRHSDLPLRQMFGDLWQWTASSYLGYPGYCPAAGAIGEYNGKFMCNQFVLRGGSVATSRSHMRTTYRNFFPPDARWQFSGIRLAR